jgi:glutamate carboxypeptidase
MEKTEASAALFDRYVLAAGAAGLRTGESGLVGGGSDACTTAALGIASIDGLGPRGRGFHTEDEQIEVASLLPKAEALARFLLAETNR